MRHSAHHETNPPVGEANGGREKIYGSREDGLRLAAGDVAVGRVLDHFIAVYGVEVGFGAGQNHVGVGASTFVWFAFDNE